MNPFRRLALTLLALLAASLTLVGLPTQAHAATTYTTKLAIGLNYPARLYGRTYSLQVVLLIGDKAVPRGYGRITVESRAPGGAWRTFATTTALPGRTWSIKARRNVAYRARYAGYSDTTTVLRAATSTTVNEKVMRDLHDSFNGKTFVVSGTVAPSYRNRAITLQRSRCPAGCAWHRVTTLRTDAASHYRHKLPFYRGRETYFRLMIPSSAVFATSYSNHWFETYPV